jgi:preprotein translocase subunit SecY
MVGGAFLLIWLCEQITRHGIGNGLALVLSTNILAPLPEDIATVITALRQGIVSGDLILLHVLSWVIAVTSMVAVESARRNVRVEFAERKVGSRLLPARSAVPIKLNNAGLLIPVTVAPWFWSLPLAFAVLFFGAREPWLVAVQRHIAFGEPAHLIIGSLLIFVLVFVYTSYVVDPDHAADRLAKHGGTIPGVAPGEPTADYLDRLVSLTTVVGAIYLTAVSLFSELLVARVAALSYEISGGSALIVVCTILDIRKQVRDLLRINARGGRQ